MSAQTPSETPRTDAAAFITGEHPGEEVVNHSVARDLERELAAAKAEFKSFHRLLCERFGHHHDEVDWKRDQLSLIEHMATDRDQLRATVARQAEEIERLGKLAENRYYEHRRQLARADALMEQLLRIHALVHPPNVSAGGREFRFNPPEHLVREAWEGLSKAIREIPTAIDAALAKEPK